MTPDPTGGIFLSYRREEAGYAAGRLADRIATRFGSTRVFIDVDSISPGEDFVEAIQRAIGRCDAVLAVIILVVNTALMYSGRTRVLALIPGMFLGFASYFATVFGGFGFAPQNPWAAWVSVLAMNALGPVFALVAHRVATRGTVDHADDAGDEAARPASSGDPAPQH